MVEIRGTTKYIIQIAIIKGLGCLYRARLLKKYILVYLYISVLADCRNSKGMIEPCVVVRDALDEERKSVTIIHLLASCIDFIVLYTLQHIVFFLN